MHTTRSDLPAAIWPPLYSGEHARLRALMAELEQSEHLPQARLQCLQGLQLQALVAHHFEHTPSFAARLQAAGLRPDMLDAQEALRALPPLRRATVQELGDGFFSRLVPSAHLPIAEHQTSGSTGQPVRVRRTGVTSLFLDAFTLRDHRWHQRDVSGRICAIRPQARKVSRYRDWGDPVSSFHDTGEGLAIPITTSIEEQVRLLAAFQPTLLMVYPTNLAALAEIWDRDGFTLTQLRHIKTMGETLSPALRETVKAVSGLALEDTYSSEEFGTLAIECPQGGLYHVMDESVILEVLRDDGTPCREGEIGQVVLTDLHNLATPLIRYAIADMAEVGGACRCGRTLSTLSRILGRERNLVRLPDGRRHWPLVGFARFGEVMAVRQYQLVQETAEEIRFHLVSETPPTPQQREALTRIAQEALGHAFRIEIAWQPEPLPVGANGKFEEFISR